VAKTRQIGSEFVDALPIDGERRLMLAVLIDAIRTLSTRQPSDSHPQLYRSWVRELTWLQSDDHTYAFSFMSICGALGFDPDYVRRYVLSLPGQGRPIRICRYAAKVGESWQRQRRPAALLQRTSRANRRPDSSTPSVAVLTRAAELDAVPTRIYAAGSL